MEQHLRNADLAMLAKVLHEQQAAKLDLVVPATRITAAGGRLLVDGAWTEARPDPEHGMVEAPVTGEFDLTAVCEEGVAAKLGIPQQYLRRLRQSRTVLFDANVNGWLHGTSGDNGRPAHPADGRSFLLRCFKPEDGGVGVARAMLSDTFGMFDHLDMLTAAMEGVRASGAEVQVVGCDLTDRRMYVRIAAPGVAVTAQRLLAGYRNPFGDPETERRRNHGWTVERARSAAAAEGKAYEPGTEPIVFAGFELRNSEVGGGALELIPRLVFEACGNGLQISADVFRRVHLGTKMEEGAVRWTADTRRKELELVTAKARDLVTTVLDVDYVESVVADLEVKAGVALDKPTETVKAVCRDLSYTPERTEAVLDFFIRGGQTTAGGVMQAVTAYSQTLADGDEASAVEGDAMRALELAAR